MTNLKSIALLFVAFSTFSTFAQTKKVQTEKSTINWVGKKVTGSHEGTINLTVGALVFNGKKLAGGNFTVDMTSLVATDLKGDSKAKLEGHLKADDFFGTDKFPAANLVIKKIADKGNGVYGINADLTIKGITKPIGFELVVAENQANADLKVDRTKYDIKYGSGSFFDGLGDKTIYDEFELKVKLVF